MPKPITRGHERRRFKRYAVLESGLIYADGRCLDYQVVDVSANGVRIRPVGRVGKAVEKCRFLLGRMGGFQAAVCWNGDDTVGIRFEDAPETVAEQFRAVLPSDCLAAA